MGARRPSTPSRLLQDGWRRVDDGWGGWRKVEGHIHTQELRVDVPLGQEPADLSPVDHGARTRTVDDR